MIDNNTTTLSATTRTALHAGEAGEPNGTSGSQTRLPEPLGDVMDQVLMMPFAEARAYALREFDRYFLAAALQRNSGNIARTARALGLHRQSLQKLMARRGLKATRTPTVPALPGSVGSSPEE